MSTSDLFILNQKSTTWVREFQNGWGSGPCIWDHLAARYFPNLNFTNYDRADYIGFERKNRMVWDLAEKSSPITSEERVALMMTFDKAYVPIAHLKLAGEACKEAFKQIRAFGHWKGVNHWNAFGDTLIELAGRKHHRAARGVVLNCTSVAEMWLTPSEDYLTNAWPIFKEDTNA